MTSTAPKVPDIALTLQASSPYVVALQGQTRGALRDNIKGATLNIANSMLYLDRVSK
ncbi:MAG: hypothetical protein WCD24_23235 [Serratia inhibens]|uniref:hypothetical protein n=1 Tax=Serratia inhibens TaxID=2338073 RepID=UPI003C7C372B